MICAPQSRPVVADGRLCRGAQNRHGSNTWGSAARHSRGAVEPARDRQIARAWRLFLRMDEFSDAHIPQRIGRGRVREIPEGHGRDGAVRTRGRFERGHDSGAILIDPDLIVEALNQLPPRSQSPGEFCENLVLLVGSWEVRIGARLTVLVAQMLIPGEKPQALANNGPAKVRRHVPVRRAFVCALQLRGAEIRQSHRLAGQAGRLSIVGGVEQKPIASLLRDDVDHRALHVAELGGRSDRLDLHFLDEVDARLGSRNAVAGHVVFVPSMRNWFSFVPEPKAETVVAVPLDGEVGEIPGADLRKSNMLDRRVGIVSRSSAPKRVPNPGSRASMREPAPSTTIDSAWPASFKLMVLSIVAPAPMRMSSS